MQVLIQTFNKKIISVKNPKLIIGLVKVKEYKCLIFQVYR